ncbi:hypothetical protein WA158_002467 [Blastocystis sp. Blastoise]
MNENKGNNNTYFGEFDEQNQNYQAFDFWKQNDPQPTEDISFRPFFFESDENRNSDNTTAHPEASTDMSFAQRFVDNSMYGMKNNNMGQIMNQPNSTSQITPQQTFPIRNMDSINTSLVPAENNGSAFLNPNGPIDANRPNSYTVPLQYVPLANGVPQPNVSFLAANNNGIPKTMQPVLISNVGLYNPSYTQEFPNPMNTPNVNVYPGHVFAQNNNMGMNNGNNNNKNYNNNRNGNNSNHQQKGKRDFNKNNKRPNFMNDKKDSTDQHESSNPIDINLLNEGKDLRTTLMIRNVPNSFSSETLLKIIDGYVENKYDFFYLPMDQRTGCNLGYAYINMVDIQAVKDIYNNFHDKHWPNTKSQKTCVICYGRIQSTENNLTEYCKGWSVMISPEKYRPKFFQAKKKIIDGKESTVMEEFVPPISYNMK